MRDATRPVSWPSIPSRHRSRPKWDGHGAGAVATVVMRVFVSCRRRRLSRAAGRARARARWATPRCARSAGCNGSLKDVWVLAEDAADVRAAGDPAVPPARRRTRRRRPAEPRRRQSILAWPLHRAAGQRLRACCAPPPRRVAQGAMGPRDSDRAAACSAGCSTRSEPDGVTPRRWRRRRVRPVPAGP